MFARLLLLVVWAIACTSTALAQPVATRTFHDFTVLTETGAVLSSWKWVRLEIASESEGSSVVYVPVHSAWQIFPAHIACSMSARRERIHGETSHGRAPRARVWVATSLDCGGRVYPYEATERFENARIVAKTATAPEGSGVVAWYVRLRLALPSGRRTDVYAPTMHGNEVFPAINATCSVDARQSILMGASLADSRDGILENDPVWLATRIVCGGREYPLHG